ncbi:MAG TPA: hypothetical protein VFZ49_10495, partial [Pyrinomonadaceae bacterium]
VVPIVFLLVTAWLLITTIQNSPESSLIGIGLIILGLPVYFYLTNKGSSGPEDPGNDEERDAGSAA